MDDQKRLIDMMTRDLLDKRIEIETLNKKLADALVFADSLKSIHNCGYRRKCDMKCPCGKWQQKKGAL
jgi:hypothetical protein